MHDENAKQTGANNARFTTSIEALARLDPVAHPGTEDGIASIFDNDQRTRVSQRSRLRFWRLALRIERPQRDAMLIK